MQFYAAASQIIPILFLAMVFESRTLSGRPRPYPGFKEDDPGHWNVSHPIFRVYAAVMLVVGEVIALAGLDSGSTTSFGSALVWWALLLGIGGTTTPVLYQQAEHIRQWMQKREKRETWFWLGSIALTLALTAIWVSFYVGL